MLSNCKLIKRPAKKRKDIFFPESSTSTPIVIHNIGGASPIVSGGEELLAHPLMSRVPNEDRTKLKTLLDRFAITQSNSQSNGSNTFFIISYLFMVPYLGFHLIFPFYVKIGP